MPIDAMIDVSGGQIRIDRRRAIVHDTHNYGVLSFTDVIVKSSNVGAIKIGFKLGTERLSRLRRAATDSAIRSRRTFPARARASCGSPDKWTDSALASVSMGYQVGVTPLQMVAAVSSVANGGEYVEPRVVRAVYQRRPPLRGAAEGRAPDDQRRHRGDADRRSWKASSSAARRTRAQIPGYTIAGKTGTAAKLINGHYSTSRLQRVVRRLPAVARSGGRDHRRHRFAARRKGTPAASSRRRSSSGSPRRRCGISASPPTINPPPPVLVARATNRRRSRPAGDERRRADRQPGRRRTARHGARSARA